MGEDWDDFVQAHGQIIGYDMGEVFLPIPPGNARAIRIHQAMGNPGVPVYGPRAGSEDTDG